MPTLLTLLDQTDSETLLLPEFQRGYVWTRDQVRGLFRSLYRGYPVGSLLTWETDAGAAALRGSEVTSGIRRILLDGQQRMTSLYGVIRGKPPRFFEGRREAFTGLYFDAVDEVFEFYAPAKMKNEPRWFDVTALFAPDGGDKAFEQAERAAGREGMFKLMSNLNKLLQIREKEFHVETLTGEDKTIDVVVDIFNRVNSGGTKLSKGDLALARISAHAPQARTRMREALTTWSDAGYDFSLDWLLRNVNAVVTGRAPFSALEKVSAAEFEQALEKTIDYISTLLDTIAGRLGMDHGRVLVSRYAIPVLTAYLHAHGGRFPNHIEQSKALYWYVHAGLWGRHAGSTETFLARDLEVLREAGLDGVIRELAVARGGSLEIREDDFSGSTLGARFYPLLYMMTRMGTARDLGTGLPLKSHLLGRNSSLEVHHIIPKARLYEYDGMGSPYTRSEVNAVANFAFLTKDSNLQISARNPEEYLAEVATRNPGALESQWIPTERELWHVSRYRDFLAQRRRLLTQAANDLLGGLLHDTGTRQEALPRAAEVVSSPDSAGHDAAVTSAVGALTAMGFGDPELGVDIADPETGASLGVAEAYWHEGLQAGRGGPVVLELDETPHLTRLQELGYRVFTDAEALVAFARREALVDAGEAEDESTALIGAVGRAESAGTRTPH